jgi:farnesyl-diphosphate farnesyltransferase
MSHCKDTTLKEAKLYCEAILPKVSRTFTLGINALRGELKDALLIGYLLCRIIDTLEDDLALEASQKSYYLNKFCHIFENPLELSLAFSKEMTHLLAPKSEDTNLAYHTYKVFLVFESLSLKTKDILKKWVTEMALGMSHFVTLYPQGIRLQTMKEYKLYCYYVAGTVGHMVSDLFFYSTSFLSQKQYLTLKEKASAFGEALQSTNILKDMVWDHQNENAIYMPYELLKPHGLSHETLFSKEDSLKASQAILDLMATAEANLLEALEYVKGIPLLYPRLRLFCILPLFLASPTLKKLKENLPHLLTEKAPLKISRQEVKILFQKSLKASFSNRYLVKEFNALH